MHTLKPATSKLAIFHSATWRRVVLSVTAFAALSTPLGDWARGVSLRADEPPVQDLSLLRDQLRHVIEEARNQVFPALVNIQLVTSMYYGGKEVKGRAVGSGTIIDDKGHVLTNQHVTNNGRRFRCTLADKQEISATLVGEDPLTDLAVLKLNLKELKDGGSGLTIAQLGDSSTVEVGDFVMAMGSPLALSRSVTLGIVSNTERVFTDGVGDQDSEDLRLSAGQRTGLFTRWIQHDALINPGNSGGPLVNLHGQVIGVNELGGNAIGFAIPSNLARTVADALIAHGEVARSWVGVSVRPIERTGFDHGVLVNSVVKGSPADLAGLQAGDLVTQVGDEPVTLRFPEEIPLLLRRFSERPIGDKIKVTFEREGKTDTTTVVTTKLERDKGEEVELRSWGMTALEITPLAALEHRLNSTAGVLVSGVRGGGTAATARPSLSNGDVIRSIDGEAVADLKDFTKKYEAILAREPQPPFVLVEFDRDGESYVTLLKPKPEKGQHDPPVELAKAWIGVAVQPVLKDMIKYLGPGAMTGFRITRVYEKTEAAMAGFEVGDIITEISGTRLDPRRIEESGLFQRQVQKLEIGSSTEVTVIRNGEPLKLKVVLESGPTRPDEAKRDVNTDFELNVRAVTFFDRVDNHWSSDAAGVIVTGAEPAGWAGLGGLQSDDLIQRIDGMPVKDLASYREAMKKVTEAKPARVVFVVLRGISTRFLYIEPEWSPQHQEEKEAEKDAEKQPAAS